MRKTIVTLLSKLIYKFNAIRIPRLFELDQMIQLPLYGLASAGEDFEKECSGMNKPSHIVENTIKLLLQHIVLV